MGGIPPALQILGEISSDIFERTPPRNKFDDVKFERGWSVEIFLRENFLRSAAMFYYIYILQSLKDKSLYIGYTTDLKRRLAKHNSGESLATKPFRPYKLIFYEAFLNRIDAKDRERYLKSGYGRKTIRKMLKRYLENI